MHLDDLAPYIDRASVTHTWKKGEKRRALISIMPLVDEVIARYGALPAVYGDLLRRTAKEKGIGFFRPRGQLFVAELRMVQRQGYGEGLHIIRLEDAITRVFSIDPDEGVNVVSNGRSWDHLKGSSRLVYRTDAGLERFVTAIGCVAEDEDFDYSQC